MLLLQLRDKRLSARQQREDLLFQTNKCAWITLEKSLNLDTKCERTKGTKLLMHKMILKRPKYTSKNYWNVRAADRCHCVA